MANPSFLKALPADSSIENYTNTISQQWGRRQYHILSVPYSLFWFLFWFDPDSRHIADMAAAFVAQYQARWQTMLDNWLNPASPMMVWMMYACNYLGTTDSLRWALDPMRPNYLLKDLPHPVVTAPLQSLSLVMLTHNHVDHYDIPLLRELAGGSIRFIVPDHLEADFVRQVNPQPERLMVAHPGQTLRIDGLRIDPFRSWHWADQPDGIRTGTDATGYRIGMHGRHWLFAGDVREYTTATLRPLAPVDRLFAHIWLGRGCADHPPPELDAFCEFMQGAQPTAITLAHLYEFSRYPCDLWQQRHLAMVRRRWAQRGNTVPLEAAFTGDAIVL